MNRIKFRRGSLNNKKNIDIEDGEPIYLTDTKRLYVSNEDVAINNVYVGLQEPNDPGINVWIDPQGINSGVIDIIYPIGSIYLSVSEVDPSILFGGVCESLGAGRTLVGVDTSQTEFNTVLKTGGSKYLQTHTHTQVAHHHEIAGGFGGPTNFPAYSALSGSSGQDTGNSASTRWAPATLTAQPTINSSGSGNSQNLQPYITVYMWKRVG